MPKTPQMRPTHTIHIAWGEKPETDDTPCTYEFNTEAELRAFLRGVDECDGWMNYATFTKLEEAQTYIENGGY